MTEQDVVSRMCDEWNRGTGIVADRNNSTARTEVGTTDWIVHLRSGSGMDIAPPFRVTQRGTMLGFTLPRHLVDIDADLAAADAAFQGNPTDQNRQKAERFKGERAGVDG